MMTEVGQDGFGMKLDALNRKLFVSDAHDLVHFAVFGLRPCRHFQALGKTVFFDDQGVIAGGGEGVVAFFKYVAVTVVDHGGLAVHDFMRLDYLAAVGLADALVSQTNPQHRRLSAQFGNDLQGDAGLVRRAGARGNNDVIGPQHPDLTDADPVVAHHFYFFADLTQILHQVVGEGVVVVDHQNHGSLCRYVIDCAKAAAFIIAFALLWVSRHSFSATESWTMPAPA